MLINAFKQNAIQFVQDRPQSEWDGFSSRDITQFRPDCSTGPKPLIGLDSAINECDVRTKNDSRTEHLAAAPGRTKSLGKHCPNEPTRTPDLRGQQ